jgi:hypothetical protein
MVGEIPGERITVLLYLYSRKVTNKRRNAIDELAYFMHVMNYKSKILNKKLKTQEEKILLGCQNGFRKSRSCVGPLLA